MKLCNLVSPLGNRRFKDNSSHRPAHRHSILLLIQRLWALAAAASWQSPLRLLSHPGRPHQTSLSRARWLSSNPPVGYNKYRPNGIFFAHCAQFQQGAVTSMAIPATQMRPGMLIKHNDQLHVVFKVEHRTPGNLRAFIQAKLRNLKSGAMFEHRFRSADAIEKVTVDEVAMDFLYADGDDYYFMNPTDYEQTVLKSATLGDAVEYLTANQQIKVSYVDGQPVGIELPQTVDLEVVETEPGLKSATASSVTKPAKTETGLVVQVPPFINEGEKIRVDTSEGAYLSRA